MPISITQHNKAGLEKLPLVVIQKCSLNASRNEDEDLLPSRDNAWSIRHSERATTNYKVALIVAAKLG